MLVETSALRLIGSQGPSCRCMGNPSQQSIRSFAALDRSRRTQSKNTSTRASWHTLTAPRDSSSEIWEEKDSCLRISANWNCRLSSIYSMQYTLSTPPARNGRKSTNQKLLLANGIRLSERDGTTRLWDKTCLSSSSPIWEMFGAIALGGRLVSGRTERDTKAVGALWPRSRSGFKPDPIP